MGSYFLKRLLFIIPTLFGVMMVNFIIIHAAPGGPMDYMMSRMQHAQASEAGHPATLHVGVKDVSWNEDMINDLKKRYGFDKPLWQRFWHMVKHYITFDFGDSYFKNDSVIHLLWSRLGVSISIGLWSTLLVYMVSIPLGIVKALYNGRGFDTWTSFTIIIGYAVPSFLFALALLIFFAGGSFWDWFPLRGLTSDNWSDLSWGAKIKDYFWHLVLPMGAQVLSGFASLTLLIKNSFLEELQKPYVLTARAQGLSEPAILKRHVLRNAMLVVVAGLPSTLIRVLFAGSLLIEMIFSLDGLGLLSYEAVMTRDYPVVFGSLYFFTMLGLFMHVVSDWLYTCIDPRIDYRKTVY